MEVLILRGCNSPECYPLYYLYWSIHDLAKFIIWWITLCLWFLPRMVLSSLVVHSEWLTVSTQSHSSAKLVLSLSDISDHNVWSWSEHRRKKPQCLTHTSILRVTNPQQTEIVVLYYWGTGSSSITVFLLLCLPCHGRAQKLQMMFEAPAPGFQVNHSTKRVDNTQRSIRKYVGTWPWLRSIKSCYYHVTHTIKITAFNIVQANENGAGLRMRLVKSIPDQRGATYMLLVKIVRKLCNTLIWHTRYKRHA